ncbi:MAG: chorismate-binding protein, partial [Alphaproteobacteria bacterium]|nr:chorismate-binding protein [Alphaproteobacteria bacterium]
DKSENLMIVDLMRNDLSRVCKIGSVKTPELFRLESYETVHHLVSVVKGQLLDDKAPVDLLRATFAGGSITGAPKIRAMEIINELETSRRGVYCGSIMWIGFDKAMDSSIVIRTMVTSNDTIVAQAGGGITAESDPEMEYNESVDKVKALLEVLE